MLLVLFAAAPAHAAPGGDVTVEQTTFALNGGAQRGVAVKCPTGRRVVGGGIGTTATNVRSTVLVSGPLDETGSTANTVDGDIGHYWYAAVYNHGVPSDQPRIYKVFALCSATSDAVIEETAVNLPAEGNYGGRGVATCPQGRRVVGGGLGTTYPWIDRDQLVGSYWQMQHSGPLDETGTTAATSDGDVARHWFASWRQYGGYGPATNLKVFALCSATSDAVVEETTVRVPEGSARDGVARCPSGRRVTGGGIGTPATPVNDYVQVSGPLDETGSTSNTVQGDVAQYWYASVYNYSQDKDYKVFALCAS